MSLDDLFEELNKQYPDKTNTRQQEIDEEIETLKKLAERYNVEFVDLNEFDVKEQIVNSIPIKLIRKYESFPFHATREDIYIVYSDIENLNAIDDIEFYLKSKYDENIIRCIARKEQIDRLLKKCAGIGLSQIDSLLNETYKQYQTKEV